MKLQLPKGATSQIVTVFIQDSSSTTGAGLGSLDQTSSIVGGYVRAGGTGVALAVDEDVTTEGTYQAPSAAGKVRIGTPANMRTGVYELHFHNNLFAAGADSVLISLGGASNMADLIIEIQLTDVDLNDGVRGGMTALPNAAADAAGGLPISDAGGLDMDAASGITLSGTASAGSATTITLTGGVATNGYYDGQLVKINAGTGVGQVRTILSYDGGSAIATVTRDWAVAPGAGSQFSVHAADLPAILEAGTAQAGAAGSITLDANASAITDTYKNNFIMITAGTGIGQTRLISAYNGGTQVASVLPDWTTTPDASSVYQVLPAARVDVGGWAGALATLSAGNKPDVNVAEISDDSTAADNLELFFDGTGYDAANSTIGWNAAWDAEVQSECNDALVALNLDHLLAVAVTGADVADDSVIAQLASKSATADWDTFDNTTDSLEGQRDLQITATQAQASCQAALTIYNLDHLCFTPTVAADMTAEVADNTILSRILANGDTSAFGPSTDGLQPIRDRGDAAWTPADVSGLATPEDVNAQVVDVVNVDALVAGQSMAEALRRIGALTSGKVTGAGTGTETFKDYAESASTIVVTVDASGNRSAITYN
jgi:hypothetical protein